MSIEKVDGEKVIDNKKLKDGMVIAINEEL